MPQLTLFYSSQLAAESEATQHLAELEKPFKCTECDSSFTTNAALNIHSKTHIKGQKLKCSICPYITNDYNELRKHRLNDNCTGKQKLFRCHACEFICHSKPMMKSHFFSAHTDPDKLHECPDCDFKALKINALNIHVKQQHSAPMEYACTSCDFVCNSQSVIKNHIIKRHSDENVSVGGEQEGEDEVEQNVTNINKYACASCDYMCSSMAQIKIHISEDHSIDSPIKSTNLQGFEESLDPTPEQSQAQRNLDFEDPLTERYSSGPLNRNVPFVRKFSCRECKFQCLKKRGIEVHMARVHKFTENVPKHVKHVRQVDYLFEPIAIGHHPDPGNEKINSHDERRMYKCPLCKFKGTLFGFKIHRNNHMSWKCKTCGAKCKSERSLQKHMKTHAGFSCDLCDFQCETDLGFQSHMDLSHNTATKRFSCPKCSYKCNTQMDLRRHVSIHEPQKQFTCPECEDSYDEKSELMHHMLSMNHTGGKPFPCTLCKAQFLTEAGLKIHLESHEPEPESGEFYSDDEMEDDFEVDEYGDRIETSSERRKSSSKRKVVDDCYVNDEDYDSNEEFDSCDECGFEGTERELKKHMKSHSKRNQKTKRLRCFYCNCTFRSDSFHGLQIHAKLHIKEGESEKKEKLRCAHLSCDYTAITMKGLLLHAKMIHQNFVLEQNPTHVMIEKNCTPVTGLSSEEKMEKCPDCDYFGTIKGLKVHSRSHSLIKPYRCRECDFKCLTENVLETHITRKHGKDEFACKECDYKGISVIGFARHYSRAHNIVISYDKENDKENPSDPFSCDKCDYTGKSTHALNIHKRVHSVKLTKNKPEKDVVETQKETNPKNKSCLVNKEANVSEQHSIEEEKVISVEIGEKASEDTSFACDDCDYIGTSKGLKTHQCKHGNDKLACSKCDFKGTTTQQLRKHTLRMHSVKVPQQKTDNDLSDETPEITVSKSESCSDNQEVKISKQHSTSEKNIAKVIDVIVTENKSLACDECDYVGTYRGLKSHMKAHSKKLFSCQECNFKGLTQNVLGTHIKKEHDKNKCNDCDYIGSAKGLKSHSKAHTKEKPFVCNECDFKCLTQKVLDTHIQRIHGNNKFACSMCNYKGPSAQGLNIHSIKAHAVKIPLNEHKSDIPIDSHEVNVSVNESCSDDEEIAPDDDTCFDEEISPDNESCLENEIISPSKESFIEKEEISSEKESCLENKEIIPKKISTFDNKEKTASKVGSEKNKDNVDKSQDASRKALSEKRVRQVNPKYTIKNYFLQGSTPKHDHTERQSKRFKKGHKETNDDIEKEKLSRSDLQECLTNETEAPLSTTETENTQRRPKRIKLDRKNTPGNANKNKNVQKKNVEQKVSPNEEGALKKVTKTTGKKTQLANKLIKKQKENNDDSAEQKLESRNSPDNVTNNKEVQRKDIHSKDSPGKVGFLQNVKKKKKFDEYMKKQGSKPDGAKIERKNIKREKGLTCLCLECGARFTAKNALEKHMSTHL